MLPKFEFFLSKGASRSDIVHLVTKSPKVLSPSLENHIVPTYELAYRILQSHKDTLALAIHSPSFFQEIHVASNIKLLIQNGVVDSNIAILLRNRRPTFQRNDMVKLVEELKDLGFNPSKTNFPVALLAKTSVTKTRWKEKVDAFKKWGWSEEDVIEAFRKQPNFMLTSIDKINLVMNFWVNQLGWDSMIIAKKRPNILLLSLEKRIIPRGAVLQFLLNKDLRKKTASLTTPFVVPEKMFIDRFIKHFKTESSYLLKLYEEKLNLAYPQIKHECHD